MHETSEILNEQSITRLTLCEVEENLEDTLQRVATELKRFIVHHEGKDIAVLVPIEYLALLEEIEDRLDVEAAKTALAEEGENISLTALKAELGL